MPPFYSVIGAAPRLWERRPASSGRRYDRMLKGGGRNRVYFAHARKGGRSMGVFYENGVADSVRANLPYGLRSNGTPVFSTRQPASRWNIQRYGLEASCFKRLGEQWSLGGQSSTIGVTWHFVKATCGTRQTTDIHAVLSVSPFGNIIW